MSYYQTTTLQYYSVTTDWKHFILRENVYYLCSYGSVSKHRITYLHVKKASVLVYTLVFCRKRFVHKCSFYGSKTLGYSNFINIQNIENGKILWERETCSLIGCQFSLQYFGRRHGNNENSNTTHFFLGYISPPGEFWLISSFHITNTNNKQ